MPGILDGFGAGTAEARIDAGRDELLDPALLAPEPADQGIELIAALSIHHEVAQVVHAPHLRLKQVLHAAETRRQGCKDVGALHRDAEPGRRQKGVLLSMDADADVVAFARLVLLRVGAALAAALVAVRQAFGRAVASGGDDPIPEDDRGADEPLVATRDRA